MSTIDDQVREPEDAKLSQKLGLRPLYYDQSGDYGNHPDQSPCPEWCWIARDNAAGGDYRHEVDYERPFAASHDLCPAPEVALSLYPGQWAGDDDETGRCLVQSAHLSFRVDQHGTDDPVIHLSLAEYPDRMQLTPSVNEHLRLSADDARDLIKALTYVVGELEGTP